MVWRWSKTAATNASADSTINWAEGMAPSAVNDSARAEMARVAQYRDDIAGAIVTTSGGTNVYALSTNQVFDTAAHMDGAIVAFTPHTTNTAACALTVDGTASKPIRFAPSVELPSGTLIPGTPYVVLYNNSDSCYYLHGGFNNPYNIPLAAGVDYWGGTAPNSSFAFPVGQAISRTTYATLFSIMGTTFGAGNGSTTFNLPDKRGRVTATSDNMGGTGAGVFSGGFGAVLGSQNQTLTTTNLPPHKHEVVGNTGDDTPDHAHPLGGGYTFNASSGADHQAWGPAATNTGGATARHGHPINFVSGDGAGNSTAFSITQPTITCNYILRII